MPLLYTFIYILLISGAGISISKAYTKPSFEQITVGYIMGSAILGLIFFLLSHLKLINLETTIIVCSSMLLLTLKNSKSLYFSCKEMIAFINQYVFKKDFFRKPFIISCLILITWMALMTLTPARKADAMRYHLAQLKDIVTHSGYIFRPYVHYHFPIYFSLLNVPLYMLAKGIGFKCAVFFNFLLSLLTLQRVAYKIDIKYNRTLFFLLFLTPISFDLGHTAMLEWPLILYILCGLLLLLQDDQVKYPFFLLSGFIALGFACGIKYQAVVFIPWFLYLGYKKVRATKQSLWILILSALAAGIIASPFYIQNYIQLHNPIWPLANHLFHSNNAMLNKVANHFSLAVQPSHNFNSIISDLKSLILSPMIPATLWLLALFGTVFTKTTRLHLKAGFILYFVTLWLAQPTFLIRFTFYFLPIALILSVQFLEIANTQFHKFLQYACHAIIAVTFLASIYVAITYSPFYLHYTFTHDSHQYQKYTWYYNDYTWINKNLPINARILVIVTAGQTYYIDREYLRADKQSALIDWREINTEKALLNKLDKLNIQYIYYSQGIIPENAEKLLFNLVKHKKAAIIHASTQKLFFSRMKNTYTTTNTYLIQLNRI